MKWIYSTIVVLIISIVLLIYELNRLDDQYTELIDDGMTQLNLVQRLTFNSNRRHILLFYIGHSSDTLVRRKLMNERLGLQKENDSIFTALIKIDSTSATHRNLVESVRTARQNYLVKTEAYLSKILSSTQPHVDYEADRELDAFFSEYQRKVNALYGQKNNSVRSLSNLFSSNVERKSIWISLFSISPFLIIGILLIILIFFLRYISPSSSER